MKLPHNPKQATTDHNPDSCQVRAKTKRPARARSGMATVAYWRDRLYNNSYKDREGRTVRMPEYYVRLRYDGTSKQVRLDHSDKEKAAEQALQKFLRLETEGWQVITSRLARLPASPTIEEFCALYRAATTSMERAPRNISITTYCRSLRQIAALAGAKYVRDLNGEAIERARDAYRAKSRKQGRTDSGIQNTLAKILRNAAACFSIEARAVMSRKGFITENPFAGIRRTQEIQPVTPLALSVLDRIYKEAHLLRDGDPHAPLVKPKRRGPGRAQIDFRRPHPDAYAALLLAIGAGLRANEIDKARWSWLKLNDNGDCFVEISEESDFKPKGGSMRRIMIQQTVYDALVDLRTDKTSPYVLGGIEQEQKSENGETYRSPNTLRAVSQWLRSRGVEKGRSRGNPLHRLRKQFGSEVATKFGLFAAQKLLGHSSPTTTARYYAAQTELPALTHVRVV
jgi:integrase